MGRALVDANVLVAAYRLDDSLHKVATQLLSKVKSSGKELVIINLVVQEIATVLSMRVGMKLARKFMSDYKDVINEEICIDEKLEKSAWEVFLQQEKKGTSFVDCANLAVIKRYKLDGILTFDAFYPKEVRIGV